MPPINNQDTVPEDNGGYFETSPALRRLAGGAGSIAPPLYLRVSKGPIGGGSILGNGFIAVPPDATLGDISATDASSAAPGSIANYDATQTAVPASPQWGTSVSLGSLTDSNSSGGSVKARVIIILGFLLLLAGAFAQSDRSLHVKEFQGTTVGQKVSNAMLTCPTGSSPCILILDASLAAYPSGTMPTLCSNCSLIDYRNGAPSGSGYSGCTTNGANGITCTGALKATNVQAISITDYGAKCDGSTDDTAAIQAAINTALPLIQFPTQKTCVIASTLNLPAGYAQVLDFNESTLKYTGTGTALYQVGNSGGANTISFTGWGTLSLPATSSVIGIDANNPNCMGQDILGSINIQSYGASSPFTAIKLENPCTEMILHEAFIYGSITGQGAITLYDSLIAGQISSSGFLTLTDDSLPYAASSSYPGSCLVNLAASALGANHSYAVFKQVNIGVRTGGWNSPVPSGYTGLCVPSAWGDIQGGAQFYVAAGGSAISGCSNVSGLFTVNRGDGTTQTCGPSAGLSNVYQNTWTGQTGAIAGVTIFSAAQPLISGTPIFNVCENIRVSTAGTAGNLVPQITFTDFAGVLHTNYGFNTTSLSSTGTSTPACVVFAVQTGSSVTFSTSTSGVTGSPVYSLALTVTQIN